MYSNGMEHECSLCNVLIRGDYKRHINTLKHVRAYIAKFGVEAASAAYSTTLVVRASR